MPEGIEQRDRMELNFWPDWDSGESWMHENKGVQQKILVVQRWPDWVNGSGNNDSWTCEASPLQQKRITLRKSLYEPGACLSLDWGSWLARLSLIYFPLMSSI